MTPTHLRHEVYHVAACGKERHRPMNVLVFVDEAPSCMVCAQYRPFVPGKPPSSFLQAIVPTRVLVEGDTLVVNYRDRSHTMHAMGTVTVISIGTNGNKLVAYGNDASMWPLEEFVYE